MKPIIIIPPKTMSSADIKMLRDNELCVVVAKNPTTVRFVDSVPEIASRTRIEEAAIQLSRKILNPGFWSSNDTRGKMAETYIDILIRGTKLDPRGSQKEKEQEMFTEAKNSELLRLAREEARKDREAAKASAKQPPAPAAKEI